MPGAAGGFGGRDAGVEEPASASPATLARSRAPQQRLHATCAGLARRGKLAQVAVTATARELAGFAWAEMTS